MKPAKIIVVAVIMITAVIIGLIVQQRAQEKLRAENESLAQQIVQLRTDNESLSNLVVQAKSLQSLPKEQFNELLKLRGEVGVLHRQAGELGKLREENQRLQAASRAKSSQPAGVDAKEQQQQAVMLKLNNARQGILAFIMFVDDNGQQFPTNFAQDSRFLKRDELAQLETKFDILYQGSITNISNPATTICC